MENSIYDMQQNANSSNKPDEIDERKLDQVAFTVQQWKLVAEATNAINQMSPTQRRAAAFAGLSRGATDLETMTSSLLLDSDPNLRSEVAKQFGLQQGGFIDGIDGNPYQNVEAVNIAIEAQRRFDNAMNGKTATGIAPMTEFKPNRFVAPPQNKPNLVQDDALKQTVAPIEKGQPPPVPPRPKNTNGEQAPKPENGVRTADEPKRNPVKPPPRPNRDNVPKVEGNAVVKLTTQPNLTQPPVKLPPPIPKPPQNTMPPIASGPALKDASGVFAQNGMVATLASKLASNGFKPQLPQAPSQQQQPDASIKTKFTKKQ